MHRYGGSGSPASAGRAPPPLRAAGADLHAGGAGRLVRALRADLRPRGRVQPRCAGRSGTPDRGIRPARARARSSSPPVHAFSHDDGSFGQAVNRCVGVERAARAGAMCPSFHATGDGALHERPHALTRGRCCAASTSRDGWKSRGDLRGPGPVSVLQGVRRRCPVERGHGHLQGRVPAPPLPAGPPLVHRPGPPAHGAPHHRGGCRGSCELRARVPGSLRAVNALERIRPWRRSPEARRHQPRRDMIRFNNTPFTAWFRARSRHAGRVAGHDAAGAAPRRRWPCRRRRPVAPGERRGGRGSRRPSVRGAVWPGRVHHLLRGRSRRPPCDPGGHGLPPADAQWGTCAAGSRGIHGSAGHDPEGAAPDPWRWMAPAPGGRVPVIRLEPSCTVMLRREITELLPDDPGPRGEGPRPDPGRVRGGPPGGRRDWPLRPLETQQVRGSAVCQVHCHEKAVGTTPRAHRAGEAGVDTSVVGGRCRLAGNWGFKPGAPDLHENATASATSSPRSGPRNRGDRAGGRFLVRTQSPARRPTPVHLAAEVMCAALPTKRRTLSP
ncbi:hypothetical protein QJS66_17275 [Kocuria rhizophila]|nr:hypothetical protein QJS66_17275 [Kocuria rhizophila]